MTRRRHKKPRFPRSYFLFLGLFIVFLVAIYCILTLRSITSPVTKELTDKQEFVVSRGDATSVIASHLYEAGIIRSSLGFRYIVRTHNLGTELQSGTYYLSPSSSTLEIANSLTTGIADIIVTIPEGFRREQIATVLEEELDIPTSDFLTITTDLEGYLFPDTYYFAPSTTVSQIVLLMQKTFDAKVGDIDSDTLILASLIERETRGHDEKPVVAGILTNRLNAGWPLELDATIQYALGKSNNWWSNTTLADRQIISPYNTYSHIGLPPHPICNPGLESITAARNPSLTDYWFYLHDRNGVIHYGRTLDEHNNNINKYIK